MMEMDLKLKEELKKEYEKMQKKTEELKKELDKPIDTTQYKYKKAVALEKAATLNISANNKEEQQDELLESPKLLLMKMVL